MVEIPAAALTVDEIAEHADFVSVGTNDLVSYTMAAERTEPGVADLLDPGATAVWRLIEALCEQGRGGSRLPCAARWQQIRSSQHGSWSSASPSCPWRPRPSPPSRRRCVRSERSCRRRSLLSSG